MTLRARLVLALVPLLIVVTALGVAATVAAVTLGGRIEGILRENYRSVDAMTGLAEETERIDAAVRTRNTRDFETHWAEYRRYLDVERNNITEPGEAESVAELVHLSGQYRSQLDHSLTTGEPMSADTPTRIRELAREIRRLNQESMEAASHRAKTAAHKLMIWSIAGLALALAATAWTGWRATRAILVPINDLTRSAQAVGDGQLDTHVNAETKDEVGVLVAAFNRMTAQLRDLRASQTARLLRAQQASQATLDAFPDPILVIDPTGGVEMANPAAVQVLGVRPRGERIADHWDPPLGLQEPLANALQGRASERSDSFADAISYRVAGTDRTYIPQVLPVCDPYGNALGAAVVLNDVTRFRLLDEFKSDLVATASHELRTPLASLRLAVHLLLEEIVGPLTAKQTELLIDARENTERLVRIVDQLLAMARLERGTETLALAPHPLADLVAASIDRLPTALGGRTVELNIESDLPPLCVDAARFAQVLDNLFVNAATYTPMEGHIQFQAFRLGATEVEIFLSDTGVGIPPEHLPYIFDKFYRVPGQATEGTGLGLAIVREVVTAHGGTIECSSKPGCTVFQIVLPIGGPP